MDRHAGYCACTDDEHPDVDPLTVRFTELKAWIEALPEFDDEPERCGERILEAIQMTWLDEMD